MAEDSAPTHAPDTHMLYRYLKQFNGIVASHTSGTNMGTDWRDNDPAVEPVVEIYQGDRQNYEMPGAPRSNNEGDSIGGRFSDAYTAGRCMSARILIAGSFTDLVWKINPPG